MNPFTCKSGNMLVSLDYLLRYYVHTSTICLTSHNVAATAPIQLSTSNTDRRYPAKGDTINYIYTNTQHKNPLCRITALETAPKENGCKDKTRALRVTALDSEEDVVEKKGITVNYD